MAKPTIVDSMKAAWQDYQKHGVEKHGLEFGRKLFELRKSAEVVQGGTTFSSDLRAAGIPARTAYYWLERWAEENGYKKLYKKGSPAQRNIIPFDVQREMALQIIRDGMKARWAAEPEKKRLIQAAKNWSMTKLKAPTTAKLPYTTIRLEPGMTVQIGERVISLNEDALQLLVEHSAEPEEYEEEPSKKEGEAMGALTAAPREEKCDPGEYARFIYRDVSQDKELKQRALEVIVRNHYLHRICPCKWCFIIEDQDQIKGVVIVGKPNSYSMCVGAVGETLKHVRSGATVLRHQAIIGADSASSATLTLPDCGRFAR